MTNIKNAFLTLFLFSPLMAFAHGEEVLVTFFLEVGIIIAFLFVLWRIDLNLKGQLLLMVVFFLVTVLTISLLDYLPFNEYTTIINLWIIVVPAAATSIAYIQLKRRFRK